MSDLMAGKADCLKQLNVSLDTPSFLSLLVSKQQPTRKLCYFGCCTLIHSLYKLL